MSDKTKDEAAKLSLNHMSLVLTLLDKEAHNSLYYERINSKKAKETGYIDSLRHIQSIFVSTIPTDQIPYFIESVPHLEHLFYDQIQLASTEA